MKCLDTDKTDTITIPIPHSIYFSITLTLNNISLILKLFITSHVNLFPHHLQTDLRNVESISHNVFSVVIFLFVLFVFCFFPFHKNIMIICFIWKL